MVSAYLIIVDRQQQKLASVGSTSTVSSNQATQSPGGLIKINPKTGLPYPGTYQLDKIFKVPELHALNTQSELKPLRQYTDGKFTLLTFFYQRCTDAKGCPYAMNIFQMVKAKLEKYENADELFQLVTISFDPLRDTPIMLRGLEKKVSNPKKSKVDWSFLTTESIAKLLPIIDGFGQNVDVNVNSTTGNESLSYSHVLKVFLIDKNSDVREIYSTAYLDKKMIINDVETLLIEEKNKE